MVILKIGLSQRVFYHKGRAYDAIEQSWYDYFKNHTLVFIPNNLDQDFDLLAETLDKLVITGGDDSVLRRTTEIKLATAMMKQQKPVLGICHGCFLLTDILGGAVKEITGHQDTEHTVNYFGKKIVVNSFHNIGISATHSSAKILAVDEQGNCEAWVDGFLSGIVWHPERMKNPWIPSEIALTF